MKIKTSVGSKVFDVCNVILLLLITASIIYPFIYMFSVSVSSAEAVGRMEVNFLPIGFQLGAYKTVFKDPQLITSYINSIVYAIIGTALTLLFNGLAAYVLSRPEFRARKFFTIMFTITMLFNGGMIPTYLNMRNLGLLDTMWAVIFPCVGMWNIILMRTNFVALGNTLIESAYIDGANDWYIFFKIVMPLSKAIFATIAVFATVAYWNNYFGPLLYLQSPEKETLPIILRRILIANEAMESSAAAASQQANQFGQEVDPTTYQGFITSIKMATVFVTIGPIIIVYPFAQKYFVKGVMIGAIKG